jgi:hypothetical protein
MIFPFWLSALLFVGGAIMAFLLSQDDVVFVGVPKLILGVVNVAILALTSFQQQVTRQVRRMRGMP